MEFCVFHKHFCLTWTIAIPWIVIVCCCKCFSRKSGRQSGSLRIGLIRLHWNAYWLTFVILTVNSAFNFYYSKQKWNCNSIKKEHTHTHNTIFAAVQILFHKIIIKYYLTAVYCECVRIHCIMNANFIVAILKLTLARAAILC